MKKILALITALSLALSMFAICAFADEENDIATAPVVIATLNEDIATAGEATGDEASEVIGDINGDGVLDIVDVVIARAYIVGNEYPADANIEAGDVNFDGVLDIVDVVIMRAAIINNTPIVAPGTDPATADEATSDEATSDEATSDEATADEATGDEATADEATADEATADEATADEATADEVTADEVTLFDGETATGNWETTVEASVDLSDAAEGGVLTITFTQTGDATTSDPAQIKVAFDPGWNEISYDYGLATDATTFTVTLTAETAATLASSTKVCVQGKYLVVTGITYTAA